MPKSGEVETAKNGGATKDNDDLAHARARGEPDSATPKGESSSCSCATHALWPPAIKVVVVVGGGDLTGVISIAQALSDARARTRESGRKGNL